MKTIYSIVKTELEHSPLARERRFRAKAMRELVLNNMGLEGQMFIPVDRLDEYGKKFESFMRIWRAVLQDPENAHLRGEDYNDKDVLEEEVQVEMNYHPGHFSDMKKLATV